MNSNKCLICYKELPDSVSSYHSKCQNRIFGRGNIPTLSYNLSDLETAAKEQLLVRGSVTGVQPKLSFEPKSKNKSERRLTLLNQPFGYILKPPIKKYPEMVEIEDLTMSIAEIYELRVAQHALIRLQSGELAYLSKRFDRDSKGKLHCEDMAQLTGTMTENKYRGSMEKIAKVISNYTTNKGNDIISLFEITLFCFITGNADMHLKNFSLLRNRDGSIGLSPAYDLLSTKLLMPKDEEEMALTLCGKKSRFTEANFLEFGSKIGIKELVMNKIIDRMKKKLPQALEMIEMSFLSDAMKENYKNLIIERTSIFK